MQECHNHELYKPFEIKKSSIVTFSIKLKNDMAFISKKENKLYPLRIEIFELLLGTTNFEASNRYNLQTLEFI